MPDYTIVLPSKPKVVHEKDRSGVYEIDGLYPGYGHTLGNSLRRIILSSIPGAAITSIKIDGVDHEFSTIDGVREDVIIILLNLKRMRIASSVDEPQLLTLSHKGAKAITAGDFSVPGQVNVLNPELHIVEITDKNTTLNIEVTVERGLGYVPKEVIQKERVDVGAIAADAVFTPIRRVNYEVENMRVGDRTDFNRLKIFIETDGTLTPREALERAIEIMIQQLKAIIGFKEEEPLIPQAQALEESAVEEAEELDAEFLKTRIEKLEGLSSRTANALSSANIRTVGGLARKKEDDILAIDGIGAKGIREIQEALSAHGITLRK